MKRCGKFLRELIFDYEDCTNIDIEVLEILVKECSNLKIIDLGFCLEDEAMIETLMPTFNKLNKFCCHLSNYHCIIDDDLKYLFSVNRKLEYLTMHLTEMITGSFLKMVPETIKEFTIYCSREATSFLKIVRVSIN